MRQHDIVAMIILAAAATSCTPKPDPQVEAIRAYVREVTGDDLKGAVGLRIQTTGVTTDGRIAKIRGTVENRYDDPVEGIRYVVMVTESGPTRKVLDRYQREVATTIPPHDRVAMSLDVESMYFGQSGPVPFEIDAQPIKVGGKEMPLPLGWK